MNNDKKTVLLVEDDESLRKVLAQNLNHLGINVEEAGNGFQAMEFVMKKNPDLVLLDIMLPGGMNGFDILEKLKFSPSTHTIPVVVLTNLESEQKNALDKGADDYIVKTNVSLDEIISKIQNKLGVKASNQPAPQNPPQNPTV